MSNLTAEQFFDLQELNDPDLIHPKEMPWSALYNLKDYFLRLQLGNIQSKISPQVHLVHPESITIGPGCMIEPGAYIEGPVILGEGTIVRHSAYIRGHVVTGKNCVIGHATEVKHSIFLNNAKAAHFNYVGDSILGNRVNLGAGVKIANLRLDQKPVTLLHEGKKIFTQLTKMGAIVGDDCQIGCNAVLSPGTLVGKKSFCYPCEVISGVLKDQTIYKSRKGFSH